MAVTTYRLDGTAQGPWRDSLLAVVIGLAALLALFWGTAASAVQLWSHTSAYNYAYLIVPIALYVAWTDRVRVAGLDPRPSWAGAAVAAAAAILWLASDLIGVGEGRQFALVGMIEGLLLGVFGVALFRQMLFPCLYLFLLVPSGDMFLLGLQRLSHAGSVVLLRLSAIPTYAEGMAIEVPHGQFLVEPGCAGLNFLLASLALSLLYAKLTYRSRGARVLCVAVALATSIIANMVRIYLIVAITEWSHRRIDIADDHLLYGWGFFAIIMLVMMWLGQRFAAPEVASTAPARAAPLPAPRLGRVLSRAAAVIAIAAVPVGVASLTDSAAADESIRLVLPMAFTAWPGGGEMRWRPGFVPGDADALASYDVDHRRVDVAVIGYRAQRDGREAAAAGNTAADGKAWEEIERRTQTATINGHAMATTEAVIRSGKATRLVLTWYASADCITASRLVAKLCAARERLSGRAAPGAFFAVATDLTESREGARDALTAVTSKIDVPAVLTADVAHPSIVQVPGAG